jgi:UrcA family protein
MKPLLCALALAASAVALGTAWTSHADDLTPTKTRVVFRNADLNDPAKAQTVRAQLYRAAQYVCESEGEGPKWRQTDDRACEAEAMQKAEQQLSASQDRELNRHNRAPARASVRP